MKKKILIGSIIAVVILTLVSFSSVVGYQSGESDLDISVEENVIPIKFKLQRIRDLVKSIDLWKIIVNPDALVDTLEEISTIIEKEDVRNYIEKSSDEDCGCNEDSSGFEWMFPTICMLLYFPFTFIMVIVIASRGTFGLAILAIFGVIGSLFNCFWY